MKKTIMTLLACAAIPALGVDLVPMPLNLAGTGVYTWDNAISWTNIPPQTNLMTWQMFWVMRENFNRLSPAVDQAAGIGTNAAEPNLLHVSSRTVAFTTNLILITTNGMPIGLMLANGFAGYDGEAINGFVHPVFDLGSYGTNCVGYYTNARVEMRLWMDVAIPNMSPNYGISNLVIYTWTAPQFFARTNTIFSQHLMADPPVHPGMYPNDVATAAWALDYMDKKDRTTLRQWATNPAVQAIYLAAHPLELDSGIALVAERIHTDYAAVNLTEAGGLLAQMRASNQWAHIDWITVGVWTNIWSDSVFDYVWQWWGNTPVVVGVNTNSLRSAPTLQVAENLAKPEWNVPASITSSYPNATNGCYVLSFPSSTDHLFVKACTSSGRAFQVFGDIQAERYSATPYTVTNSTDSTFGYGSGLMRWDTNYIYVSVATNRWKRSALTTW